MKRNTPTLLPALALLVLGTALPAQTETRSGSYSRMLGSTWMGCSVNARASLGRETTGSYRSSTADADLSGRVHLLRHSGQVGRMLIKGRNRGEGSSQSASGSFEVFLLSKKVVNRSFSSQATLPSFRLMINLFPVDVSASVPVGPFTITVAGNAGVGIQVAAGVTFPALHSVGLQANAQTFANGRASVAVGVPGAKAGVEAIARFAAQSLNVDAGVRLQWGLVSAGGFLYYAQFLSFHGGATYTLEAVQLRLVAFVKLLWSGWSETLANWSWGRLSRTLLSF